MMGAGVGRGEDRARQAAEQAIRSPLLEGVTSMNAKSLVINITSGEDPEYCATLEEVEEITAIANQIANLDEGNIFFGTAFDPDLKDEIRVTVVATGLVRNAAIEEPVRRSVVAPSVFSSAVATANAVNVLGGDSEDVPAVLRQTEEAPAIVREEPPVVVAAAPVVEQPASQPTRISISDFLKNQQRK